MEEIVLEVETITPLFIAGADQRNIENEGLRAPSLRGAMRWWFRAIAGGFLGNDIRSLIKAENEIFGSTSSKSKVTVKTSTDASPKIIDNTYRSWREAIIWNEYIDYFFFSCLDKRKDKTTNQIKVKSRPYYPEGSKFTVVLQSEIERLKVALASLWALIHLGGIGFRARRGAGSLKVKDVRGETFGLNFIFKNSQQLEKEIGENIAVSQNLISDWLRKRGYPTGKLHSTPKYAVLSPNYSALFIKRKKNRIGDWKSALEEIGKWYLGQKRERKFVNGFRMKLADFDFSHTIQYANAKKMGELTSDKERRPYLGLPISYATYKATLEERYHKRRASPFLFGVYRLNNCFIPRIVIFNSEYLPNFKGEFSVEKKIGRRKISLSVKLPDNKALDEIIAKSIEDLKRYKWQLVWGGKDEQ